MARLNKTDTGAVVRIMNTEGWNAVLKLVAATINDLNSRETPGENEFQTLRSLFLRQGQVKGLREFFDGIEKGESLSEEAERSMK